MNLFFAGLGDDAFRSTMGRAQETYQGVFNAGTGASRSFNDVAKALMQIHAKGKAKGKIEYIPFPDEPQSARRIWGTRSIAGDPT